MTFLEPNRKWHGEYLWIFDFVALKWLQVVVKSSQSFVPGKTIPPFEAQTLHLDAVVQAAFRLALPRRDLRPACSQAGQLSLVWVPVPSPRPELSGLYPFTWCLFLEASLVPTPECTNKHQKSSGKIHLN